MIILTLRTDKPASEIGLYEDDRQLKYEIWEAHRRLAETLHDKIRQLVGSQQKEWSDIQAVIIFRGPGSFTGLRIGISVANALGYSYGIPVIGVTGDDWIAEGIAKISGAKAGQPIIPFYGSDANITTPTK